MEALAPCASGTAGSFYSDVPCRDLDAPKESIAASKSTECKEKLHKQDILIKLSGLRFVCGFTAAGLTFRFQSGILPQRISIGAAVVFLGAYLLYAEVLRENTYLSRTIEVQESQKAMETDLSAIAAP